MSVVNSVPIPVKAKAFPGIKRMPTANKRAKIKRCFFRIIPFRDDNVSYYILYIKECQQDIMGHTWTAMGRGLGRGPKGSSLELTLQDVSVIASPERTKQSLKEC